MTTPTLDDTAALVAEAREIANERRADLSEHDELAPFLDRLAAALEAATADRARDGRMPVEIVARAICKAKHLDPDEPVGFGSDDYVFQWERFKDAARAALGDAP